MNLLDYGNRNYDATLGRFITIDRFSQKYLNKSPYHYGANNPILYADKAGDSIIVAVKERLYLGVEGRSTTSVTSNEDLGLTTFDNSTTTWNYNETTNEIDVFYYPRQDFSPLIKPGADNKFTQKNIGIGREARAHENGHVDQFKDIAINGEFSVKINNFIGEEQSYTGGIQDILDKIYSNYEKDLESELKSNPFKLSEEKIKSDLKSAQTNAINSALSAIFKQMNDKLDKISNYEEDANKRSEQYLSPTIRYNNGARRIIFWKNKKGKKN